MPILAGETRDFPLNTSRVRLSAPEDCECERVDEDHVIISLASLPECKIYLDIVPYNQRRDPSPTVPHDRNRFAYTLLCDEIIRRFNFDPRIEYMNRFERLEFEGWFRMWWHNQENIGMEIWMHRYDGWMFRMMAGILTEEESSHIRSLVENIVIEI